ncbi:hypothetical protein FKP32DRAFT_1671216 [Trametes sanguinea]|nr:hypothetical protein FKP32DRAFT_1671216 [Trametes sanguinea]
MHTPTPTRPSRAAKSPKLRTTSGVVGPAPTLQGGPPRPPSTTFQPRSPPRSYAAALVSSPPSPVLREAPLAVPDSSSALEPRVSEGREHSDALLPALPVLAPPQDTPGEVPASGTPVQDGPAKDKGKGRGPPGPPSPPAYHDHGVLDAYPTYESTPRASPRPDDFTVHGSRYESASDIEGAIGEQLDQEGGSYDQFITDGIARDGRPLPGQTPDWGQRTRKRLRLSTPSPECEHHSVYYDRAYERSGLMPMPYPPPPASMHSHEPPPTWLPYYAYAPAHPPPQIITARQELLNQRAIQNSQAAALADAIARGSVSPPPEDLPVDACPNPRSRPSVAPGGAMEAALPVPGPTSDPSDGMDVDDPPQAAAPLVATNRPVRPPPLRRPPTVLPPARGRHSFRAEEGSTATHPGVARPSVGWPAPAPPQSPWAPTTPRPIHPPTPAPSLVPDTQPSPQPFRPTQLWQDRPLHGLLPGPPTYPLTVHHPPPTPRLLPQRIRPDTPGWPALPEPTSWLPPPVVQPSQHASGAGPSQSGRATTYTSQLATMQAYAPQGYDWTPTPPGGFPAHDFPDPEHLTRGMAADRLQALGREDLDGIVLIEVHGVRNPTPAQTRQITDSLTAAISSITAESAFRVVPPETNSSSTWAIVRLSPRGVGTVVNRRAWASRPLTFYGYPPRLPIPRFLCVLGGFAHDRDGDILHTVWSTFNGPHILPSILNLVQSNPAYANMSPDEAANAVLSSLEVRVSCLDNGNILAAVYCDSPTASIPRWREWRDAIARVPFRSLFNSTAHARRPTLCDGCHGASHPTHLCPMQDVPGWVAPAMTSNRSHAGPSRPHNPFDAPGPSTHDGSGRDSASNGQVRRHRDDYGGSQGESSRAPYDRRGMRRDPRSDRDGSDGRGNRGKRAGRGRGGRGYDGYDRDPFM